MLQVLSTNTAVPSGFFARSARRNYQQDACKKASGALRANGTEGPTACREDLNYPPTAVGGICMVFLTAGCREDLNYPPTAVRGIQRLWKHCRFVVRI